MTPKSEIDVAGTFLWPNCDVNGSRHLNTQCRGGSCWSNFLLSFYYLHGGVAPPNPNKGMVVVTIKSTWGSRWANSQQTNGSRREKKKTDEFLLHQQRVAHPNSQSKPTTLLVNIGNQLPRTKTTCTNSQNSPATSYQSQASIINPQTSKETCLTRLSR